MRIEHPWIEVSNAFDSSDPTSSTSKLPSPSDDECHALFAARVRIKPFKQISRWKWGWNIGSLLEEALQRQHLFIRAQYPTENSDTTESLHNRALALRCILYQDDPKLHLFIMGKVRAPNAETARSAAINYWRGLASVFPYDYELVPVTTQQDFYIASGWSLLQSALTTNGFTQIQRFEGEFLTNTSPHYIQGNWQASPTSNEQIWRAIAGSPCPLLFDVSLLPTTLQDTERVLLAEIAAASTAALDSDSVPQFVRADLEQISNIQVGRVSNLRRPYLVQLHVITPEDTSEFLLRAVGSAVTSHYDNEPAKLGYQVVHPSNQDQLRSWRNNVIWLEPNIDMCGNSDPRLSRIRHMADSLEAHVPFRWPFPPEVGIPDTPFALLEPPDQTQK